MGSLHIHYTHKGTVTFSPHLWRQGEKHHVCLLRQLSDVVMKDTCKQRVRPCAEDSGGVARSFPNTRLPSRTSTINNHIANHHGHHDDCLHEKQH